MATALRVYRCVSCGVRTVEPFVLHEQVLCAMCADQIAPNIVSARERVNRRRFDGWKVPTSRFRD